MKLKRQHTLILFLVILVVQTALWYGLNIKTVGKISPLAALATGEKGIISAATITWLVIFLCSPASYAQIASVVGLSKKMVERA